MSTKPLVISPSILSADFSRLGDDVRAVDEAGADWIHVDVMDGRFVPNITIGPLIVRGPAAGHRQDSGRAPDDRGAGKVCGRLCQGRRRHHQRSGRGLPPSASQPGPDQGSRQDGRRRAPEPRTPLDTLDYCLELCDLVLVMSVNPGFGGQSFIESQVQKIRDLRRMCDAKGLDPWIEVDGGIKAENAWMVIEAGANAIVSGSGVFNQPSYAEAITGIRNSKRPQPALV